MTVEENLLLGSYPSRARQRRRENLARVYRTFPVLGDRPRQDAGTLSGGEQQMLAMGRALMSSPTLLMPDEPSLVLAPMVVRDVFAVIAQVRAQGVAVLLVEQNVTQALAGADRAYTLENGRVTLQGLAVSSSRTTAPVAPTLASSVLSLKSCWKQNGSPASPRPVRQSGRPRQQRL